MVTACVAYISLWGLYIGIHPPKDMGSLVLIETVNQLLVQWSIHAVNMSCSLLQLWVITITVRNYCSLHAHPLKLAASSWRDSSQRNKLPTGCTLTCLPAHACDWDSVCVSVCLLVALRQVNSIRLSSSCQCVNGNEVSHHCRYPQCPLMFVERQ